MLSRIKGVIVIGTVQQIKLWGADRDRKVENKMDYRKQHLCGEKKSSTVLKYVLLSLCVSFKIIFLVETASLCLDDRTSLCCNVGEQSSIHDLNI